MLIPDLQPFFSRREPLKEAGTTIYRGIHTTETQGLYALDCVGTVGILSLYTELSAAEEEKLANACLDTGQLETIYLKRRPPEARHLSNVARDYLSPSVPILGPEAQQLTGLEAGVPYLIRPGADLSIGLFTDARLARQWVRERGAVRVLNTFAYTCGFGLNAVLGGAGTVKNVDLSRKVLTWGQENYALSGLSAPDTDFLYGDVFEWLSRLRKRQEQFDLVVLDPPSFARSQQGIWRSEKDYCRLVMQAAAVTASGGQLLTLLNHAGVSAVMLSKMVQQGLNLAGRRGRLVRQIGAGADYPGATHLKVQVWQLDSFD